MAKLVPSKASVSLQQSTSEVEYQDPTSEQTEPARKARSESDSDEVSQQLISSEMANLDRKAPLPAPLHVIEAFASRDSAPGPKLKLSSPDWSVSELESPENDSTPLPVNSDGADSTGPWGPLHPLPVSHRALPVAKIGLDRITKGWVATCSNPPTAEFLHDGTRDPLSDQRDIDTGDGTLLSPVEYPETHKSQNPGQCHDVRDVNWRQANMTSELWIAREIKNRNQIAQRIRAEIEETNKVSQPTPVEEPWPTANCLLRPATPNDFAGIAAVMNKESRQTKSPQVIGPATTGTQDIRRIYENCRRNKRPFIVAVPSASILLDRSKWPEGADNEYEEFVRFKRAQKASSDEKTILGFGFVTESRMDVFGSPSYGSRFTGRITVLVDPAHRRKLYGSALLDRILLSVAAYHGSLIDYKWECSEPASIYEQTVTRNWRQYARVYIEALFHGEENIDQSWIGKMLGKFEFKRVARFEQAVRAGNSKESEWLDLAVWELQARPAKEIGDDAPSKLAMY